MVVDARTVDERVDIHAPGVVCKKSACYFCHQNCGVLAYVKDGDVLRIEGDPEHPTNQGGLCCRGNIALTHLHHPGRINHPLKRVGEKGGNQWERISWDQAINEIAAKLNQIKAESGAEAVATAGGTLRTEDWSRRRFMNLFGSPNSFHNALLCWIPTFMVETAVSGWSPFETDLGGSKVVILWGMNPGASAMPGMRGYSDLKKKGLKIIVVDPRYSETAAHADLWLPLRPGSDTALALAMINVIINEGMFDFEFIDEWCEGFGELADHVEQYTPEWASKITWLDPELIREAARMYAMNRPGNIQWGCTADQMGRTAGAGMHARAILRAITGNLDRPGGDVMPGPAAYITDEEIEANDMLPEEQKAKQIGYDKFKLTSWQGYGRIADIAKATWGKAPTAEWMCEAHGPSVFKAILTGDPYQVRALLVSATNPLNSYGDTKMTLAALKKVEFMVVCDYWMTPTGAFADYIMPIAGALERPTIHTNYGVTDSIVCRQRAIDPLYERHTDFEFWRDLGLACGQTKEQWPWEREEDVFFYMLSPLGLPIESYDDFVVNHGGMYYPPQHFFRYQKHGFCTASRKVELKSSVLEELGYPALPTYIGSCENVDDTPEVAEEYPLTLTTGGGFMPYHHSEHFNIAEIRYLYKEPRFTINPRTAKKLGIKDGDWCWIETRRGRMKQVANVEESVDPRVIYAQRGWWYPERDLDPENPFGCLDSNVNVITSVDDEDCCPIGGSWANRGLLCRVYKVSEGDKVTNEWSIPGKASEPGIHETYSTSKLAYEVIPQPRRHYPPDFEVPEGLEWDELRRVAYDPATGYRYDKNSGWLIDPQTNVYYDLVTKYAYDPSQNDLVDAEGNHYDLQTRELKVLSEVPTFDMPEGLTWDVPTQQAWDPATGQVYDPNSGWLIDPQTNVYYDVVTRYAYDPEAGDLVDAVGNHYDMQTRELKGAAVAATAAVAEAVAEAAPEYPELPAGVVEHESGWLLDEATGTFYDPVSHYMYCPVDGDLVDVDGNHYDLETRQPKGAAAAAAAVEAVEEVADEAAAAVEETVEAAEEAVEAVEETAAEAVAAELPELPATVVEKGRWLFDTATEDLYDPETHLKYDKALGALVDAAGNLFDKDTKQLKSAVAAAAEVVETVAEPVVEAIKAVVPELPATVVEKGRWLFDTATEDLYDPETHLKYDKALGALVDAAGNLFDLITKKPKGGVQ